MPESSGPLESLADGVSVATGPVRIVGMRLSTTMTVLRIGDDDLWVHSPIALTTERRREIDSLGRVVVLYAPNTFHHLHLRDWVEAFPEASLHGPPSLSKKRPDLDIAHIHGASAESKTTEAIEEIVVRGFRLEEAVLFYRPARLLIVSDLVHNVGRPEQTWAKFYTRLMGFYDRVALSRLIRWTAFSDRQAARESVREILALPFDKVVVGHGKPILENAKQKLADGLKWLVS